MSNIPKPNNFAEHKPCVVLLMDEKRKEAVSILSDEEDKPIVFERFVKARKHVSQHVDPSLFPRITFANEEPVIGAGDREATHNKKCLKCRGFLRPTKGEVVNVGGKDIQTETYVCPKCDG